MEIKRDSRNSQLLQARAEGLQRAQSNALRPLGKLWGMDVFTWYAPSVYELSATIQAFPFPVMWLGTESQLKELASVDAATMRTAAWIGQYDHAQLTLPTDVLEGTTLTTATEGIEDSLELLKNLHRSQHILLFTAVGNEWKTAMEYFEQFVKQHQKR